MNLITAEDAADRLGVDTDLLLGLARHGQMPFIKHPDDPKTIMFEAEQIDGLAAGTINPAPTCPPGVC